MKISHLLPAAVLATFAIPAFSQIPAEPQPYIEVTGIAEKEVLPDEIYIAITLKEKYVNKVKVTIQEQENKLKESLQKIGIGPDQLYLSDADASYVRVTWRNKDVLTQKDYTLKVSDAPTVGKVFQALDDLDIKDANLTRISHSKMDSLRKEVRIMAIKAARDKAEYLLEAIGARLGKPLIINEFSGGMYGEMESNVRNSQPVTTEYYLGGIVAKDRPEGEIQFQKIRIQAAVSTRFSIQ